MEGRSSALTGRKSASGPLDRAGEEEISKYKQLLSYNLVEPLAMELYTINVDGSGLRKITELGGSNWAPFYLADNRRLIFSTNFNETGHFGAFDLFVRGRIRRGSPTTRADLMLRGNGASPYDLNLFLADWVE
ncbi:hypothetical protein M3Y99_00366300 [Aphelenchoides fujianensis]|nr:hypothetical protein M3Y99_00366300 [Aphelenchoides fujianensis]